MVKVLVTLSALAALAGCDLSYSGATLYGCDGGSFPGAICPVPLQQFRRLEGHDGRWLIRNDEKRERVHDDRRQH